MVGPISSEDRSTFAVRVKLALTALVAVSAGLIAVNGDASLPFVALATLVGAVVGAMAVWFVFPGSGETKRDPERRFDR